MFNIITGINESKIITMHISCEFKCKFDGRKCNSNQKWNNDKCWCECKNTKKLLVSAKDYIWILLHVVAKMEKIFRKYFWQSSEYVPWSYKAKK